MITLLATLALAAPFDECPREEFVGPEQSVVTWECEDFTLTVERGAEIPEETVRASAENRRRVELETRNGWEGVRLRLRHGTRWMERRWKGDTVLTCKTNRRRHCDDPLGTWMTGIKDDEVFTPDPEEVEPITGS